jgi:hypothetical protein
MLAADIIAKWRAAAPVSLSNGLGLLFDRELMERDERRWGSAPSGGGRRPRLPGHPPVWNLARTANFSHSTISRLTV